MCGIFGITSVNSLESSRVKESAKLMQHRGPNAYGQWGIDSIIELAHLRLSIIDLQEESNQPFFSGCGNFVIVFNGEIYNYLELKNELIFLGHTFRTASDTEVLLNSYIEWGDKCVTKFNGDWGFAIYDIKNRRLFCSRDRFGVKPFNYALVDGKFIFASEIKPILNYFPHLRQPNYNVIANFCRNSLGAQIEETWFEGIYRLLPAHNLIWSNGQINIEQYWKYPIDISKDISWDEAKETYQQKFINAVKLRMRSDVPVGTTLSSGLDSSSIVSVLRKFYNLQHKTFTAVFDPTAFHRDEKQVFQKDIAINESNIVKQLAEVLNLDAHLIDIKDINLVEELSKVIYYLESGHSSPATLPLTRILEYAKDHVTVIMEGQGADELLGGYVPAIFPILLIEYCKKGNVSQLIKELNAFSRTYSLSFSAKMFFRLLNKDWIERCYQFATKQDRIFGQKLKKYNRIKDYPLTAHNFDEYLSKHLFESHTGGLVNLLHYGDAISMSKSLENRTPFMDVDLVEFAFTLPFSYKMRDGLGKYIHRSAMENIVPQFILENPIKFGFNTPLHKHFNSYNNEANTILLSERCLNRGIFDKNGLYSYINEQVTGKQNHSSMLFRLLSTELWFRQFID